MTQPDHHEDSADHGPAESGGPRPDPYPEFPPLPIEHEQPQAPDPEGTDPGIPGAQAPAAASFAPLEAHPQPAMHSGSALGPDPDAETTVPAFGAAMAAYAASNAAASNAAATNVTASTVTGSTVAGSTVAEAGAPAEGAPSGSLPHRIRFGFRGWRRSRPFWGGLFVVLGGGEILFSEKAPLRVIVHFGLTGLAGYLIPSVMVLCGVLMVFNPAQRLFYSILAVLLALATWPTSNLGGFLIGMLLGLIGGSLGFAWMPLSQAPAPKAKHNKPPKAAAHG